MNDSPKTALQTARELAGFRSAVDFVRRYNLVLSTYRSHENGTRGLPVAVARQYAALLNVPWSDLLDAPADDSTSSIPPEPVRHAPLGDSTLSRSNLPLSVEIRGSASCGDDGRFDFNGEVIDYAPRPPKLAMAREVYAIYVTGTSMSPWREPRQLVYVNPRQPVSIGDYVVVQMKASHGEPPHAYIKRLVGRTARDWKLEQFEPRKQFSVSAHQVLAIHRIMDWPEVLGI